MEVVEPPRVQERPELPTLGIRVVTPFRGMISTTDTLSTEAAAP